MHTLWLTSAAIAFDAKGLDLLSPSIALPFERDCDRACKIDFQFHRKMVERLLCSVDNSSCGLLRWNPVLRLPDAHGPQDTIRNHYECSPS